MNQSTTTENDSTKNGRPRETSAELPPKMKTREAMLHWMEQRAHALADKYLVALAGPRGLLSRSMREVPEGMHRLANQTSLVLDLIEDFSTGAYRDISWVRMALLSGAVLYTLSPADVVPDAVPFLGALDDLSVIAVATRLAKADLQKYCRFKGYAEDDYFRMAA